DAADEDPDRERDRDADDAHGQRDLRADEDAREEVAPEAVGAEREERPALDAEQVPVKGDEPEEAVAVAPHEEPERQALARVLDEPAPERDRVALLDHGVDEGPHQAPLVHEVQPLDRKS